MIEKFSLTSTRALSPKIANLLRFGDTEAEYQSRSEVLITIANGFVSAGWPREVFLGAILDKQNIGGDSLRTRVNGQPRSAREAHRRAEATWRDAVKWIGQQDGSSINAEVLATVASYRKRADEWRWPVRGGVNFRKVLEAHFAIVEFRASLTHGASVRDIALRAEVGIATVKRAHLYLVEQGWLTLHKGSPRGTREAAQWRLTAPTGKTVTANILLGQFRHGAVTYHSRPETEQHLRHIESLDTVPSQAVGSLEAQPRDRERECSVSGHDLWRRGGLGAKAGLVYGLLPQTVAKLSAKFSIKAHSVHRYLRLLKSYGLALAPDADGIWPRGPADPAEVATAIGATGLGAAQRKEYKRQQDEFDRVVLGGGALKKWKRRNHDSIHEEGKV